MPTAASLAAAVSSGCSSDENNGATGARKAVAPLKNVSRERMKAERAFLRKKVVALERELSALLAKKAVAQCLAPVATPSSIYRGLAKRQHARRLKAEDENARLKSKLLHQLQVAKSLEAVLRNRASTFLEDVSGSGAERVRYPLHDLAALHEQCMDEIDQAYALVDSIFNDSAWTQFVSDGERAERSSTVVVQPESCRERLFVELRTSGYAPFSFERVCRATWKAITNEHGRHPWLVEQAALTDDEYKSKFSLAQDNDRFSATITMRKFVENSRVVLVWRSLDLKETPLGSCLYGDETGWVVVERERDPVTQQPSEHASTVRVCTRYVPIWDGKPDTKTLNFARESLSPAAKQAPEEVGEFTTHILTATDASIASIAVAIENILLEEATGSSQDDDAVPVMLAAGLISAEAGVEVEFAP